MTSQIDPTKPTSTYAYTADVRSNFAIAASEISALQDAISSGPFLPLAGGSMTGPLEVQGPLILSNLPTTAPEPGSNILWNNNGVLNIA
jgi:hypothetical protein